MAWRPISGQHSIERVRVLLSVEQPLRPKVLGRLADQIEEKRNLGFGPRILHQGQGLTFQMGPNGPVAAIQDPQGYSGWEFQAQQPVAADPTKVQIVEVFSIVGQVVTYDTASYDRWEGFKERFSLVAGDTLRRILADDEVASLSLEYHNRFYFDGDPSKADPSQFLALPAGSISVEALKGAELWHLHRGWFEPGSGGKLLINQNFDAQDGLVNGRPSRSVQVVTRADARAALWPVVDENVEPHLNFMHDRVEKVFEETLTVEMKVTVGLGKEVLQ